MTNYGLQWQSTGFLPPSMRLAHGAWISVASVAAQSAGCLGGELGEQTGQQQVGTTIPLVDSQ